jgi:hypothetical protein
MEQLERRHRVKSLNRSPTLTASYKTISYHRVVLTSPVPSTIHHARGFIRHPSKIIRFDIPLIVGASNGTHDPSSVSLSRPEMVPWLPPITDRPPHLMDSRAPASPSYINHPKAKTEEEKVDVIAEELAVKADVEDASQLRLDSVSEATMTATVWVLKRNNGSTDESVTFGGAMLAGDVLFFLSFFLEGFIKPTSVGLR